MGLATLSRHVHCQLISPQNENDKYLVGLKIKVGKGCCNSAQFYFENIFVIIHYVYWDILFGSFSVLAINVIPFWKYIAWNKHGPCMDETCCRENTWTVHEYCLVHFQIISKTLSKHWSLMFSMVFFKSIYVEFGLCKA